METNVPATACFVHFSCVGDHATSKLISTVSKHRPHLMAPGYFGELLGASCQSCQTYCCAMFWGCSMTVGEPLGGLVCARRFVQKE